MNLTTPLPNGRLQVNKAAVIAKLKQLRSAPIELLLPTNETEEVLVEGVIGISRADTEEEYRHITAYRADNFINHNRSDIEE